MLLEQLLFLAGKIDFSGWKIDHNSKIDDCDCSNDKNSQILHSLVESIAWGDKLFGDRISDCHNSGEIDHEVCKGHQSVLVDKLEHVEEILLMRSRIVNVAQVKYLDDQEADDFLQIPGAVKTRQRWPSREEHIHKHDIEAANGKNCAVSHLAECACSHSRVQSAKFLLMFGLT